MTREELAKHDALKAEYDKLDAEYAEAPDYDEEIEQLGAELDALNDRTDVHDPAEVARVGAFVMLNANGGLRIERGFIRPEDEPQPDLGDGEAGSDADGRVEVNGLRPTGVVVNGAPQPTEGSDDEDETIRPLPDRLVTDLTAQRESREAAELWLAKNPHARIYRHPDHPGHRADDRPFRLCPEAPAPRRLPWRNGISAGRSRLQDLQRPGHAQAGGMHLACRGHRLCRTTGIIGGYPHRRR